MELFQRVIFFPFEIINKLHHKIKNQNFKYSEIRTPTFIERMIMQVLGEIYNWAHWLYIENMAHLFSPKTGHWIPREIKNQLIFLVKNREDTKEHSQLPTDKRTKRKSKIFEFGCLAVPLDLKNRHWAFTRQHLSGTHTEHQQQECRVETEIKKDIHLYCQQNPRE